MKYNDRLAYQAAKERQQYSQQVQNRAVAQKKFEKMLDGLLLMYSCRVKNPHQAIKSKLAGENIVDVREEDPTAGSLARSPSPRRGPGPTRGRASPRRPAPLAVPCLTPAISL